TGRHSTCSRCWPRRTYLRPSSGGPLSLAFLSVGRFTTRGVVDPYIVMLYFMISLCPLDKRAYRCVARRESSVGGRRRARALPAWQGGAASAGLACARGALTTGVGSVRGGKREGDCHVYASP